MRLAVTLIRPCLAKVTFQCCLTNSLCFGSYVRPSGNTSCVLRLSSMLTSSTLFFYRMEDKHRSNKRTNKIFVLISRGICPFIIYLSGGICPFIIYLSGGICPFIANDSVYILTIIVKFPTIIVVRPRAAKNSVDKSKKLKIDRTERSEKTKNKKDRAFTKKGTRPATIFLVIKRYPMNIWSLT